MFENSELLELREHRGADSRELDIFCYFAYYPYLNA